MGTDESKRSIRDAGAGGTCEAEDLGVPQVDSQHSLYLTQDPVSVSQKGRPAAALLYHCGWASWEGE